jgi:hypothetical protein
VSRHWFVSFFGFFGLFGWFGSLILSFSEALTFEDYFFCYSVVIGSPLIQPNKPKNKTNQITPPPTHHFSNRNDPITSASSGEVKNAAIASRGVQTIGSPRMLNEVFTKMGTPVLLAKAATTS